MHLICSKRRCVLWMVSAMAMVCGTSSAVSEEVVYRETFPVAEGQALKLTDVGWQAWVYSTGDQRVHRGAAGYSELMRPKASQPGPLEAIAADVADDAPDTGMLVNWNGGKFWPNPTLYHTSEFKLESSDSLHTVSWFQNNQGKTGGFRLALKIGPTWIVSDQNHIGYLNVKLLIAEQKWRHLNPANLSMDAEATMTELPDGPIEAFGVFGVHTGYAELDNFTVSVSQP